MNIAILSDSHDHKEELTKALEICREENLSHIIHCGDMVAAEVIEWFAKAFKGTVHYVIGNNEDPMEMRGVCSLLENVIYYGETAEFEIDGITFAVNHYPERAEEFAAAQKYNVVCHGHDHKYREVQKGETLLVNPGTVGGVFAPATFYIYNTKEKTGKKIDI